MARSEICCKAEFYKIREDWPLGSKILPLYIKPNGWQFYRPRF